MQTGVAANKGAKRQSSKMRSRATQPANPGTQQMVVDGVQIEFYTIKWAPVSQPHTQRSKRPRQKKAAIKGVDCVNEPQR